MSEKIRYFPDCHDEYRYIEEYNFDGYNIGVGGMNGSEPTITLNYNLPLIAKAIEDEDIEFFDILKRAIHRAKAVNELSEFDDCIGRLSPKDYSWRLSNFTFNQIIAFKKTAQQILDAYSKEPDREKGSRFYVAMTFMNALEGDFPEYKPTNQDMATTKLNRLNRSMHKWKQKLIDRDGYKCTSCGIEKDLCIKRRVAFIDGGEVDLNNFEFKCRKCLNK